MDFQGIDLSRWIARKTGTDGMTCSLLNQCRALHPDSDVTIPALPPPEPTR